MKILFVDQFGELGGAQQCLLDLLPGVYERGWEAICAAPSNGPLARRLEDLGATVLEIDPGRYNSGRKNAFDALRFGWHLPRMTRLLRQVCLQHAPDLIYVNGPRMLPAVALSRGHCPILFHSHNYVTQRSVRLAVAKVLRWIDSDVMAVSEFAARQWRPFLCAERIAVVPNGVAGSQQVRKIEGIRRIGIVGRIAPEKGHHIFLQSARILQARYPQLRFSICGASLFSGSEYYEEVKAMAADLPVEFPGWQDDIGAVLSALDMIVVPSVGADAAPRVVLEAFAAGVPVVAFPCGGIPELIENRKTGFLTDASNADSLASLIGELIQNIEKLQGVAERAYEVWQGRYTLARYRERVTNAMARLIESRRTAPQAEP